MLFVFSFYDKRTGVPTVTIAKDANEAWENLAKYYDRSVDELKDERNIDPQTFEAVAGVVVEVYP